MMESAKCTLKEAAQAIQDFDFEEDICRISRYIKKNTSVFLILIKEYLCKDRTFFHFFKFALILSFHQRFSGKTFFYAAKTFGQGQKLSD